MLKEEVIGQNYSRISRKEHQVLFTKLSKQGIKIRILVFDSSITGEQQPAVSPNEIDSSKDVYEIYVKTSNKQNLRMFRMLKGISGLNNHLLFNSNWFLDIENNIFKIMCKGQQIKSFQTKKSQMFNIFNPTDLVNLLKQKNQFQSNELSYILAKSLVMQQEDKEGKVRLSKIDIQHNKKRRKQSILKQKEKKQRAPQRQQKKQQKKQEMIMQEGLPVCPDEKRAQMSIVKTKTMTPSHIFSDSIGIDSFEFINREIIKQQQEEDELCIYGSTSITYKDHFTIKLKKLSKENGRNPVIWIGFADLEERKKHKNLDTMEKFIVMGDKKKIKLSKKILWKDLNDRFLESQFYQQDIITVRVNRQSGVITWTETTKGTQFGSCVSDLIVAGKINFVPFVQLWKKGDIVEWIE